MTQRQYDAEKNLLTILARFKVDADLDGNPIESQRYAKAMLDVTSKPPINFENSEIAFLMRD